MGITGLLPFLEKASRPAHISEFSGCSVAIDSYCWLHKGAFSCADKLARGEKTDMYVLYCMKFVNMLLSFNIKPILVFDGMHLPAKAETEKKRKEMRETNRRKAAEFLRLERESEARSLLQRSVDITHEMALELMKHCRAKGVDCIVAPFEADPQLAYLNINGLAHIVITEDSDLMLFGCKLVMFKMDLLGNGILVEQAKIPLAMKQHPNNFSMDKFRYMCILSGCDYLKSLPGIGLGKATKFIKKTQDDNISRALTRLGAYLNMPNLVVTPEYREKFLEADKMFKYQPVFDPRSRSLVPLNPFPKGESSSLMGLIDSQTALQLALGNVDPFTLKQVNNWDPDQALSKNASGKHKSIWCKTYQLPAPLPPGKDPRDVKHHSTKGRSVTQNVSVLTKKISVLPQKADGCDEIFDLRKSYNVKPPPTKKLCFDGPRSIDILNNDAKEIQLDSGVGTDSGESEPPSFQEGLGDILKPSLQSNHELSFTVDDILDDETPHVSSQGGKKMNPFSSQTINTPKQTNPVRGNVGGALDSFSKLKKTQVEAACIVQSRYFAPKSSVLESASNKTAIGFEGTEREEDKCFEMINATPSPKRRSSLFTRKLRNSPRKNLFEVIDSEEFMRNNVSPSGSNESSEPNIAVTRKNMFAVTPQKTRKQEPPTSEMSGSSGKNMFSNCALDDVDTDSESLLESPQPKTFLKILDDLSKGVLKNSKSEESMVNVKDVSIIPSSQSSPPLGCQKTEGSPNSLVGLYRPRTKTKTSLTLKSPKGKPSKSSPLHQRKQSIPNNTTFKQKTSSGSNQKTLFMFAFQPKPKLSQ